MNIIEDSQARVSVFCPLCGTQNVNEEGKITECTHFEGAIFVGDDDILFDKNGIFGKAQGKAEDIHHQINELLDKKFSEEENIGNDEIRDTKTHQEGPQIRSEGKIEQKRWSVVRF